MRRRDQSGLEMMERFMTFIRTAAPLAKVMTLVKQDGKSLHRTAFDKALEARLFSFCYFHLFYTNLNLYA